MIYDFSCSKCKHVQEGECRVAERTSHTLTCAKCGGKCKYIFTPTVAHVIFKDGPSGSWPSKGERFKNFRRKKHEEMGKRQRDRYGEAPKLVPNIGGVQTESWREQKELVKQSKNRS